MSRVRVAIDPAVKQRYGTEVCWVWRLLLTDIGLPWEEVPVEHPQCDLAYVTDDRRGCRSRIRISADLERWERLGQQRLAAVAGSNGCWHPIFQGEAHTASPFAVAAGQVTCDRDIIFDLFWLSTGQAERHFPKNAHGHYDLTGTVDRRDRGWRGPRICLVNQPVGLRQPRPKSRSSLTSPPCERHSRATPSTESCGDSCEPTTALRSSTCRGCARRPFGGL